MYRKDRYEINMYEIGTGVINIMEVIIELLNIKFLIHFTTVVKFFLHNWNLSLAAAFGSS